MSRIAFIGLGKMGTGMASRLLGAGHEVRVYNRTRAKAEALARAGARVCASPREACADARAVFAMLADDAASRAIWRGDAGILAADLPSGAFAIECSTLSHGWVLELSRSAGERGLRHLDAPVTGLPANASDGSLTLLVGASRTTLDAARPLLEVVADRILRFGEVGAGTAYKLIVNMVGAVQIASIAEGIALAERAGLDMSVVAEALATSQAASPQVLRNARRMLDDSHDDPVVFTPTLRLKDTLYALQLAGELDVASPFGELAAATFRALCDAGDARANESKVIEIARKRRPE